MKNKQHKTPQVNGTVQIKPIDSFEDYFNTYSVEDSRDAFLSIVRRSFNPPEEAVYSAKQISEDLLFYEKTMELISRCSELVEKTNVD